jgi:lipopolysaccharide transport system ATP-binding protein
MNPALEISGLSKQFSRGGQKRYFTMRDTLMNALSFKQKEKFWALKDISFEVARGERLGIIGHNGAGKTSLLKILSRITPPTEGRAIIRGTVSSLLEVGTGFHPELSGRENIYFNGAIMGMTKLEIKKQLDSIIDFSGINAFVDTALKHYSSGMQLRLAFAVAAHMNSDILMIDEILAVGDVEYQRKCITKMNDLSQSDGKTLLLVSHNMSTIQSFCERTIILKDGKIQGIGESRQIIQKYLKEYGTSKSGYKKLQSNSDVSFEEVELINSNRKVSGRLFYGEPFKIKASVISDHNINKLTVIVGLNDQSGQRIFSSVSTESGKTYDLKKGEKQKVIVEFTSHEWQIKPGTYSLYISIFRNKSIRLDSQIIEQFIEISETAISAKQTHDGIWGIFRITTKWT